MATVDVVIDLFRAVGFAVLATSTITRTAMLTADRLVRLIYPDPSSFLPKQRLQST
jgi:hypothetical protein